MSEAAENLNSLLSEAEAGGELEWGGLANALQETTVTHTEQAEQVLVSMIRSNIKVPLTPGSELPNAMSPEDLLKSEAIQALVKWTGAKYRQDFEKVLATAESPALVSIIRSQLRNL